MTNDRLISIGMTEELFTELARNKAKTGTSIVDQVCAMRENWFFVNKNPQPEVRHYHCEECGGEATRTAFDTVKEELRHAKEAARCAEESLAFYRAENSKLSSAYEDMKETIARLEEQRNIARDERDEALKTVDSLWEENEGLKRHNTDLSTSKDVSRDRFREACLKAQGMTKEQGHRMTDDEVRGSLLEHVEDLKANAPKAPTWLTDDQLVRKTLSLFGTTPVASATIHGMVDTWRSELAKHERLMVQKNDAEKRAAEVNQELVKAQEELARTVAAKDAFHVLQTGHRLMESTNTKVFKLLEAAERIEPKVKAILDWTHTFTEWSHTFNDKVDELLALADFVPEEKPGEPLLRTVMRAALQRLK